MTEAAEKQTAANCDCSNGVPVTMLKEVGSELKAAFWPCPSSFVTAYKEYYFNKSNFKECCIFKETKFEQMPKLFAVHFWYVIMIFIFTLILRIVILSDLGISASPINEFDLISLLITVASFMWLLTITKHTQACGCMDHWVNAAVFSGALCWLSLSALLSAINNFQVMEYNAVFIIPALLNFADMSVLIPLAHYTLLSLMVLKNGAAPPKTSDPPLQQV